MPDSVQYIGDAVNKAGNDSALGSMFNRMDLESVIQSEVHSVSSVSSVRLAMFHYWRLHKPQHTRPPSPSPIPGVT